MEHGWGMPEGVEELLPVDDAGGAGKKGQAEGAEEGEDAERNGVEAYGPFVCRRLGVTNSERITPFSSLPTLPASIVYINFCAVEKLMATHPPKHR